MSMASHDQESHVASPVDHLDLTNGMVLKGYVAHGFNYLDLMNTVGVVNNATDTMQCLCQ